MMNIKMMLISGLCMLLVACGGGGNSGSSPFGSGSTTIVVGGVLLTLDESSVTNTDTTPVKAKVVVTDSSGKTLSGVNVTFSVSGAQFSVPSTTTGSDGSVTADVIFSNDKTNRLVQVSATAGSLSASESFVVTGSKLSSTAIPAIVTPGGSGQIEFALVDANANPIINSAIQVSSSLGVVNGTTNSSGKYIYSYTLPGTYASSDFVVTAVAKGTTQSQTINVQLGSTTVVIPNATASPAVTVVEIDPAVIGTNPVGSPVTQTATVRFKAFGTDSLPLKNVRVSFDLNGDANGIGGTFSTGTSLAYTDSNGVATTTYTSGPTASATDGLTIRACYSATDFTPSTTGNAASPSAQCPTASSRTMTINNEALNVAIGSNDKIEETSDGLRYVVKYVVQVVNASGVAKSGVTITPTLDLLGFRKGYYTYDSVDSKWVRTVTSTGTYQDRDVASSIYSGCPNEDVNRNGVRDAGEDQDSDDELEPPKSDAAVSIISSSSATDSTGSVALQVTYMKNVATWLRIKLYVKGAVSGTEGIGTFVEELPAPTSVLNAEDTPAFATNPYGSAVSCSAH